MYKKVYDSLFEKINKQTLIITANKRLSDHLYQQYFMHYCDDETHVLMNDVIIDMESFVAKLWFLYEHHEPEAPLVISKDESFFLLRQIMQRQQGVRLLAQGHVQQAYQAWQTLQQWQLGIADVEQFLDGNINVTHFISWALELENYFQNANIIDSQQRLAYMLASKHFAKVMQTLSTENLLWVGFDALAPNVESLLQQLNNQGIKVDHWALDIAPKEAYVNEYSTVDEEIQEVIYIIKRQLTKSPNARIAMIVPDLQQQFEWLKSHLDQHFVDDAEQLKPHMDNKSRKYTISAGEALYGVPIVYQLFAWCRIEQANLYEELTQLLCSPYVAGASENRYLRVKMMWRNKAQFPASCQIKMLLNSDRFNAELDETLCKIIQFVLCLKKNTAKLTVNAFINCFTKLTQQLHWGRSHQLSSLEYQALEQFYQLLNKLRLFSRLKQTLNMNEWLTQLEIMAKAHVFQTQSSDYPALYVLGALESSEIYFDYIYMIRMTDKLWPPSPKPNIYLPYLLQKVKVMPHASADRELFFAEQITKRVSHQAYQVCFSYARLDQEQICGISPLLKAYMLSNLGMNKQSQAKTLLVCKENPEAEISICEVDALGKKALKGGVQVLKNIAECPYRAALIHRLFLSPPLENLISLSALDKGIIIHHVLEQVWLNIKTQDALKELELLDLNELVEKYINTALYVFKSRFIGLPEFMQALEKTRLKELLVKWLIYERARTQKFEVVSIEKRASLKILGVELSLRIDRVDRLEDEGTVVIDYKTARKYSISSLYQTAITEPQLAMYAIIEDSDAIAVASVYGANIQYQSISAISGWLSEGQPKVFGEKKTAAQGHLPENFEGLKAYWKEALTAQMQQFLSGDISLSSSAKNCQYCEFDLVCKNKF